MPALNFAPQTLSRYLTGTSAAPSAAFPPNLAASISKDTQKKIMMWVSQKYLWPQIQERVPFERGWDKMLEIARITLPNDELFSNLQHTDSKVKADAAESNRDKARVSDSVIHDAIERLTNITRFVAFKEKLPVQFNIPDYISLPHETAEYRPMMNRVKGGNALLQWNADAVNLSRQSTIAYRHHYTYGCAFVVSDYRFKIEQIARQANNGQIVQNPEITEVGTTFQPISIRKVWLNWRLPAYDMDQQPCPFYYEETPRFAVLQNAYHPQMNPFGYVNLDSIFQSQYLYTEQEFQSVRDALQITYSQMSNAGNNVGPLAQILEPKHSVEARWHIFPMLPFDAKTGDFEKYLNGDPVPYKRFIMETFGPNLHSGAQVFLRLQEMYFPKGKLPLYASVHMPDLDSGAYAPSIGQVLYNHFVEITMCHEQFLNNKDWINTPPSWIQMSSPSINANLTQKGAKLKVNGPNDFGWRQPYDATASTVTMIQMLKDDAKTTSKAVDAILGKAMGSRTTATEANNVFQAAMSGITADIDLITGDLHGAWAERVWDYSGLWMDKDLLLAITGQLGFELRPEDMWFNLGLSTSVGSSFIEKSVRQQNIRYILESGKMEVILNRAALWKELLESMGFDSSNIVQDGGREQQIQFATLQACQTYLGEPVIIDPDQDHDIAIKVKTGFLKDTTSPFNTKYGVNAPLLVDQIKQHQLFLQLQMQQALLQQQTQLADQQLQQAQGTGGRQRASEQPPVGAGAEAASHNGGSLN